MTILTGKALWLAAAEWGSFMRSGDPGACMYGFDERGAVQSEQHRAACLAYIDSECRHAADVNIAAGDFLTGHADLDRLRAAIAAAPVSA